MALPLPDWSKDAQKWCEQLLSDLGEDEREAGKRLALFDETVEEDLLLHLGAKREGLEKLLDWRLVEISSDERYALHDIVKEYWRSRTSEVERVKWHKAAGEWLREQAERMRKEREGDVEKWDLGEQKLWVSFLRRAFWHFVSAGERGSALKVAKPITKFLDRWGNGLKICDFVKEHTSWQRIWATKQKLLLGHIGLL